MAERRYPLELLADRMGCSVHTMGERLSVAGSTLQSYRDRGLTARVADRLAIRAGYHPALIWPTWVDDALTEVDRQFLAGGWRPAWLWNEAAA